MKTDVCLIVDTFDSYFFSCGLSGDPSELKEIILGARFSTFLQDIHTSVQKRTDSHWLHDYDAPANGEVRAKRTRNRGWEE